ncbi:MAG: glycosyltransferase [Actinomycetota bacterium]|nr:glycosyltransferase [Actinomycetota bacterium]
MKEGESEGAFMDSGTAMNDDKAAVDVTLIGTLPPLKGISPYCAELASILSEHLEIEFIDFKRLYPEILYPGKTCEDDLYPIDVAATKIKHRRILDVLNPFTWLKAGLSARGYIVHAQWWTGLLFPVYMIVLGIARLRGKRIIITVHNVDPHEGGSLLRFLNCLILPLGDEFIVHGESCREKLVKRVRSRKAVHVVPHPPFRSAQEAYDDNVDVEAIRRELGLREGETLLIFFGNIRDYKGLDVLLRALPEVREVCSEARLLVAGECWGDWGRYERIIHEEAVEDMVITRLGYLPYKKLEGYILASDLAVFPFTHLDSASSSVTLALSLGKSIVVSEVGDMAELRRHGVQMARPGCPASLAETIALALRRDNAGNRLTPPDAALSAEYAHKTAEGHILAYWGCGHDADTGGLGGSEP